MPGLSLLNQVTSINYLARCVPTRLVLVFVQRRRLGQIINFALFKPFCVLKFLFLIALLHAFQRFNALAFRHPAAPMHFYALLTIEHNLLLRTHRLVEARQKSLVIF